MTTAGLPATAVPGRLSNLRHAALAGFWFGSFFHWVPILGVLIPYQVSHLLPKSGQGAGVAGVVAVGAIFAVLLPPAVGAWSDRLSTRWGRRRPIMAVGSGLNAVALLGLLLAPSYPALVVSYVAVQIFNNAAGAAYNAVIPDVVPAAEFGKASGLLAAMVQVGSVAGLAATLAMSALGHITWTYAVIAAVLLTTIFPTLWASKGEGLGAPPPLPRRPFREAAADFLAPLRRGDFAWVIGTRTMVTAGIYSFLPFLQFFFADVVRVGRPADFTAQFELILLLVATPFGLIGGWLSDRHGRKLFVYLGGGFQGLLLLVFVVFYPTQAPLVLALGAVAGIGYGLYYAVDWALACDTLPDRASPAKDMGLFHVALTLPQVLVQALAGVALDAFNRASPNSGYRVVFSAGIVFYLLGTVFVSRIKSVR